MAEAKPTKTPERRGISAPRLYKALMTHMSNDGLSESDPIGKVLDSLKNRIVTDALK